MKKKIANLLRKWANKLSPQIVTCAGEDPCECSFIPIKSDYKLELVRCAYIFPHRFGKPISPNDLTQAQMDSAYKHIAEEFAKHFLTDNKIKFDLRTTYNNDLMLEGEMYVGVKQDW